MTYIPARPIVANDPLAYFAALTATNLTVKRSAAPLPATRVLDVMYGYYTAD